ncbi:MAG: YaeQ family protein [Deltaproteobacteria bacterium]|nr:YaeQ family protein [Deltaproteobacteria bacterium]
MAQAPTLCHFELALSHVDRGINETLSLRTARHPSETAQRVWLRVLAYAWQFCERIEFGPGLSDPDSPDLLATNLVGETTLWMRVGKADPQKVQRAADQNGNAKIAVLFESPERMRTFIDEAKGLTRLGRVELGAADPELVAALAKDEERRSKATITIVGDHFYIEKDGASFDGPIERASIV